jgi:hypothetical protein
MIQQKPGYPHEYQAQPFDCAEASGQKPAKKYPAK